METMETNTREGIMSRGHPHTEQSRMKISQANKGKTPWNIGKKHSEETKRKIAVKTREAYLRRKEAEEMRIQTEEPEKWAAMLAEKEAVVTRAVRAKEEKAAAVIAKTAKAEAAAAAKVVRAAERTANLALPEKDRKSIYSQEVRDKIS